MIWKLAVLLLASACLSHSQVTDHVRPDVHVPPAIQFPVVSEESRKEPDHPVADVQPPVSSVVDKELSETVDDPEEVVEDVPEDLKTDNTFWWGGFGRRYYRYPVYYRTYYRPRYYSRPSYGWWW